jgi:hypothetical protein
MVGSLTFFVVLSQLYLGFTQNRVQIAIVVISCVALDFLFTFLDSKIITLPLSGIISGLGLCLLLDAGTRLVPFFLAAILCIGSKYVVRYGGRHFYNPSTFALTIIIWSSLGTLTPGYQWGGGTTALWIVMSLGMMLLSRVRRLALVGSFLVLYLISAAIRVLLGLESGSLAFGLMTGAPFQLFTFFMLTDPRTTPKPARLQMVFAAAVIFVDFILRVLRIHNTLVISLFLVDTIVLMLAVTGVSYNVNEWPSSKKTVLESRSTHTV